MQIHDLERDESCSTVSLRLTRAEILQLIGALEALMGEPNGSVRHEHVSSDDYQTEVTVWLED